MDVANSSICMGSSKVSEGFFQFYRLQFKETGYDK
jgi:hypothetical protein